MDKFFAIIEALYQGKSLKDPAVWKDRHMVINAILTILGVIIMFKPDLPISGEAMDSIAGGIATVLGLISAYLIPATSEKVGLRND